MSVLRNFVLRDLYLPKYQPLKCTAIIEDAAYFDWFIIDTHYGEGGAIAARSIVKSDLQWLAWGLYFITTYPIPKAKHYEPFTNLEYGNGWLYKTLIAVQGVEPRTTKDYRKIIILEDHERPVILLSLYTAVPTGSYHKHVWTHDDKRWRRYGKFGCPLKRFI